MRKNVWNLMLCGLLLAAGCSLQTKPIQRKSYVTGVPSKNITECRKFYADLQADVTEQLQKNDIQNYAVYLGEIEKGEYCLFSYVEYAGDDFSQAINPCLKSTEALTKPLATSANGQMWSEWKEVFHLKGKDSDKEPVRHGWIIGMKSKEEARIAYEQLHAAPWPGVVKMLEECNIRNYSIYMGELKKDKYLLFSYLEYVGDDFDADMAKMGEDKVTQVWWTYTDPLQIPLPSRKEGQHWSTAEEVFCLE